MLLILFLLCTEFATRCSGQTVQNAWLHPHLGESITNGSNYHVTWSPDLIEMFQYYCPDCDTSKVDLCLQPSSNRDVNVTIGKGINIATTTVYSWDVDVSDAHIGQDDWVLRFIPHQGDCNGEQQISSSSFFIKPAAVKPSSSASTSSTSSSSTSSSSTSSSSTSSTSTSVSSSISPSATPPTSTSPTIAESVPPSSTALSTGAKAGIGAGIGLAGLLFIAALLLFLRAGRSRDHALSWFGQRTHPEKEPVPPYTGPYLDASDHSAGWKSPFKSASLGAKPEGTFVAQSPQELDSRHVISEVGGDRRDR